MSGIEDRTKGGEQMKKTSYEEALERYLASEDAPYSLALEDKLQPSRHLSTRDDADSGWVFRNVNGFLAYVGDAFGQVLSIDLPDGLTWEEAVRGTMAEIAAG
jgi:hypothetical protein